MSELVNIQSCKVEARLENRYALRDIPKIFQRGKSSKKLKTKTLLKPFDLKVRVGDRIAIIGQNGAGKSSLLRLLAGFYFPTTFETFQVTTDRVFLENLGTVTIPEFSGRANIDYACKILGLPAGAAEDICAFTEIGEALDLPMDTYSAGMQLRVVFGIMTARPSKLLLIDEILGVGDAKFQAKGNARLNELTQSSGALVVATHSMDLVGQLCNKCIVVNPGGTLLHFNHIDKAIDYYMDGV